MLSMLRARPCSALRDAVGTLPLLAILSLAVVTSALKAGSPKEKPGPAPKIHALVQIAREVPGMLSKPRRMSADEFADYLELQMALLKSPLVLNSALHSAAVAKLPAVKQQKDPQTWLAKRIKVEPVKRTGILRIAIEGGTPDEQALLANAVADAYLVEVAQKETRRHVARLERLKRFYAEYDEKLRDKRATLRQIQGRLGGKDDRLFELNQQFAIRQVQAVEKDLLDVQAQMRKLRMGLILAQPAAEKQPPADSPADAQAIDEALRQDAVATRLLREVAQAEIVIATLNDRSANPSAEPSYQKAQAVINTARKALADRRVNLAAALQEKRPKEQQPRPPAAQEHIGQLRKVEEMLRAERESRLKAIPEPRNSEPDIDWLREEIRALEEVTKEIARQIQRVELELQAPSRISILQHAEVPGK